MDAIRSRSRMNPFSRVFMSNQVTQRSDRLETIFVATMFAAVWWLLDAGLLVVRDGEAIGAALFPDGVTTAGRLIIAIALGITAVLSRGHHSRAIRREVGELNDCDLQYKTIIESTFDSIITVNERSEVVAVNAATTRTFGGVATAFVGREIDDLIVRVVDEDHPDRTRIGDFLDTEKTWAHGTLDVVAQGLNHRQFIAELTVIPTRYGDKSNQIIFIREVTERVLAKRALVESEEKYRDLFEQLLEGVYRSLADGTILAANPAMVRLLGYSSEGEMCSLTNARDLLSRPEQHDSLIADLGNDGEVRDLVVEVKCKDGSRRTVLANMKAIPAHYDDGIVYQGTLSDISELQRTTFALRDSEEHFRALADNTPDIVSVIDENSRVLYCSPSCLGTTGFSAQSRTGSCAHENVHPDDLEVAKKAVDEFFEKTGTPKWFNFRYMHRDGSVLHMEAVATSFLNSQGKLRAVINTRDISHRHRTMRQLQQAQKMQSIGQLTGGIAHDFNNLLTVIVGNLQLIEEASTDQEINSLVDMAYKAAMHGADLTHRLLAFAKRQPLEPKVIDVNELLGGMETLLRRSLGEQLSIDIEGPDDLWLAKVDPVQLESAILNLAINARDAMGTAGQLLISASNFDYQEHGATPDSSLPIGEYVRISVTDNGSGMTEEIRKKAIEPFVSTKEDTDGSGLGLSMVYGFVQQSGGHLRLDSQSGQGTCIMLYLPRSDEMEIADSHFNMLTEDPVGSETVLVVDDNNAVRHSVSRLVSKLGYEVIDAPDGATALRIMDSLHVDLLFSDIKMPGMSGFELAATTRERHPTIHVMLTSGFTEEPAAFSRNDLPDYDFLHKPYDKHRLATKIRANLDQNNER